jgi:hypothetical protein
MIWGCGGHGVESDNPRKRKKSIRRDSSRVRIEISGRVSVNLSGILLESHKLCSRRGRRHQGMAP